MPDYMKFRYRHVLHLAVATIGRTLFCLMKSAAGQECSDPRDRVYRVLGLMNPMSPQLIHSDYSLTTVAVYKYVFLSYMRAEGSFSLFRSCYLDLRKTDGPSWVPDWSVNPCRAILKVSFMPQNEGKRTLPFPRPAGGASGPVRNDCSC
jgi:hypothetical protein